MMLHLAFAGGQRVLVVKMIATQYKSKLPKGVSYPVNASEISMSIDEAIHEDLTIAFSDSPTYSNRYCYELLQFTDPILVCEVKYWNLDLGRSAPREYREHYTFMQERDQIYVYPVRSVWRREVNAAMMIEGLTAVRDWLFADRPDTWRTGRHSLALWWNPESKSLSIKST